MGCMNSSPEKTYAPDNRDPGVTPGAHAGSPRQPSPRAPQTNLTPRQDLSPRQSNQHKTKTGYSSDVGRDHASLTVNLVHLSKRDVREFYNIDKGAVLGRGACGAVTAVTRKADNQCFALKTVSIDSMGAPMEDLLHEIEIHRTLDHPNICKIFESFCDEKHGVLYIVMEMCSGGALVSRMRTHAHGYGEKAAATLVEKMLSAILYCHHHGVVHRDIKLDNFIYENEAEDAELKLIDFGFACEIAPGKEGMWDQLGTPSYMAPELWSRDETMYDSSVDMWAIGVVTYMLLSGKRPFQHADRKEKARMIRHDPLQFPDADWAHVSKEAKDFCSALMMKRPRDRLNATDAIHHPWIAHKSTVHQGKDAAHEMLDMEQHHHNIIASLEAFCAADDLKKLALEVIAFSTPPAKLEELRNLFVKMDTDDSGTISLSEFKKAMELHPEIPQEKVESMFADMDVNASGEVDYSEFLSATLASQNVKGTIEGPSILSAFSRLDTDGDGFITKEDIHAAFEGQLDDAEVAKMLRHQDPSGRLNYQGFKRMMLDDMTGAAGADVHPQKHDLCEESGCGQHLKRAVTKKRDRRISQVILGGGKGKGSLL